MKKEINGAKREGGSVKRPIQRTVLLRGGSAGSGASAGAFCGNWGSAASNSYWYYAARPRLKNPSGGKQGERTPLAKINLIPAFTLWL